MQTKIYTGQISNYAREPDANGILQLSWQCASHSLGDISVACKKCSRLGREGHSIVKELKLGPAYSWFPKQMQQKPQISVALIASTTH